MCTYMSPLICVLLELDSPGGHFLSLGLWRPEIHKMTLLQSSPSWRHVVLQYESIMRLVINLFVSFRPVRSFFFLSHWSKCNGLNYFHSLHSPNCSFSSHHSLLFPLIFRSHKVKKSLYWTCNNKCTLRDSCKVALYMRFVILPLFDPDDPEVLFREEESICKRKCSTRARN